MRAESRLHSSKLLTLRLTMSAAQESVANSSSGETAAEPTRAQAVKRLTGDIGTLNPSARAIVMELLRGEDAFGIWTFTARDLKVPVDPEAYLKLQYRFSGLLSGVRAFASHSAYALSERFPGVVKLTALDDLRQRLSSTPSLPLFVADSLRRALDTLDRNRTIVWLEFQEPLGFLPWLAWEHMLREVIGVPIVRRARQPVDALAPQGSLDVLVAATGRAPSGTVPNSVAALCREVLKGVPSPGRCVIHVFADTQHREPVLRALKRSKLTITEGDEPAEYRGVVVYPFPTSEPIPAESTEQSEGRPPAPLEYQWPRWIRSCMRGRSIDTVHVISEAGFPGLRPSLEVIAVPWAPPERVPEYFFRSSTRVQLRHVEAPQLHEFASSLGAWAVVFSAPSADALRAQRALAHQLSGLLPGVFVVHDLVADPTATACRPLYQFLARCPNTTGSVPLVPDSPYLVIQCHPSRFAPGAAAECIEHTFGAEFLSAAKQVKAAMETQDATPAWAAVLQRQIEQSVSSYLSVVPVDERDKAAQDAVVAALTTAMQVIARHTKSST